MKNTWTKPKTATTTELREQLAEAKRLEAEAIRAVHEAEAVFDDAGDEPSAKAVSKAREALQLAGEHVARAERLVAGAEEREAIRAREMQGIEADAQGDALSAAEDRDAELLDAELSAWGKVIELRLEREAHRRAYEDKIASYQLLCAQLGRTPKQVQNRTPIAFAVREWLRDLAESTAPGPRRDLINKLAN